MMKSTTTSYNMSPLAVSFKAKTGKYFGTNGRYCASHPWEVIVTTVTLTVCILSMTVLNTASSGAAIKRTYARKSPEEQKADSFLMIIVNSLAILYLYNQFTSLKKVGSKYLLGISTLFMIFASFIFGGGAIYIIDPSATGLNEVLPFFLLLIDLSKAATLAEFASISSNRDEVRQNIGKGMEILGPTFTLDTIVEVLIISIGTISGVRQLEVVCYFGCMSLVANYIIFMTFFPAALALILEVCPHNPSNKTWHIDRLARAMEAGTSQRKPNPVVQRVKIIMSLGLIVVHVHSRFLSQVTGLSLSASPSALIDNSSDRGGENGGDSPVPLSQYIWWKLFHLSLDQCITIGLAVVLLLKYAFYDRTPSNDSTVLATHQKKAPPINYPTVNGDITTAYFHKRSITIDDKPHLLNDKQHQPNDRKDSGFTDTPLKGEEFISVGIQTEGERIGAKFSISSLPESSDDELLMSDHTHIPPRSIEECLEIFKSDSINTLSDAEVMLLVNNKHIPSYKLETVMGDPQRGVAIRRKLISLELSNTESLNQLPYIGYDYSKILGACCENVIGYMPLPVGVAGPLLMDSKQYYVPMATTEGCLVASTNRGCRALMSFGVSSNVVSDGMTRGPVLRLPSAAKASELKLWLDDSTNFTSLSQTFNSTSNYAKLQSVHTAVAGRLVYVRFKANTGDAMGMNMLSKGVERSLVYLREQFPDIEVLSISGNYCTDKKPSAVNWIEGRGKYVICDAIVPAHVVDKVLKTSVDSLIEVNISKNLVGSAMAGSIGGFNAHAANIVTAIYIATGQDPAQVVGSSNCITLLERGGPLNNDLYISCTMPSLEVGTVGGGTFLPAQSSCLDMLGVKGSSIVKSGDNSSQLARIICATVLAGELSLLSALAAGHLVKSHLTMNRSQLNLLTNNK